MSAQSATRQAAAPQTPPLPEAKPESLGLSSSRLQRMSDVLRHEIDKGTMPGATIMVARGGQVGWFDALGKQAKSVVLRTDDQTMPSSQENVVEGPNKLFYEITF